MGRPTLKECIENRIKVRKETGELPVACMFQITTPQLPIDIEKNEYIQILTNILKKYKTGWVINQMKGSFHPDKAWIHTDIIPCYITDWGTYPVDWDADDLVVLEGLATEGKVVIMCYNLKELF